MDYRISESDQLFVRYTQSGSTGFGAPKMPGLACGCGYSSQYNFNSTKGASIGETHIFTPNTLNEFRIGFNWNHSFPRRSARRIQGAPRRTCLFPASRMTPPWRGWHPSLRPATALLGRLPLRLLATPARSARFRTR